MKKTRNPRTTPIARTTLIALTALASGGAMAQIKTDGAWRGSGGAALSLTSGNTSSRSLLLNAEATKATLGDKISLGATANQAKNKTNGVDETTADKWSATGQYDYNLSPRSFVFGKLGFEGDQLVKLDRRTSLAAGVGYKLIDTQDTSFEVFGGAGYTSDRYSAPQTIGSKTDTRFSRTSLYLAEASSHQLSPTVALKQRLEVYPGLDGDKAVLAKFTAGLSVSLNSTMSLNVGLTDSYNSKPPGAAKSNDLGLFTGINVKFGAI